MAAYYINLERGYSWVPNKSDTMYDDVLKLAQLFGAKHVWSAPVDEGILVVDGPGAQSVVDLDGAQVQLSGWPTQMYKSNHMLDAWGLWREKGWYMYNDPVTGDEFGFSM